MLKKYQLIYFLTFAAMSLFVSCSDDKPDEPDPEPPVPVVPTPEPDPQPADTTPEFQTEPFQQMAQMTINTAAGAEIRSKEEYVDCTVSLLHDNSDWNFENVEAGIRGRGNSTWEWYPKKPYRIKFSKKQPVMGLGKAKSWVLLAEYRDPTDLMNAFVFELGHLMKMPFTNHNRFVELTLNGRPQGLYHLTEQVQQGDNRVEIDEKNGILLQFDRDDGPELAPEATDNFWSSVYFMPVCVKNPENLSTEGLADIREQLAQLERAIQAADYEKTASLLNVPSMIDFLIIQELVYNVELDAPRSMYCHRDVDGKWTMGPLWDFDGGFDFSWANMQTSHNYFANYKKLVMGLQPSTHQGTDYDVPGFFTDLFKMPQFVRDYKSRWAEVGPLIPTAMANAEAYYKANQQAWQREQSLWPINKDAASEIAQLHSWLDNRRDFLNGVVAGYK